MPSKSAKPRKQRGERTWQKRVNNCVDYNPILRLCVPTNLACTFPKCEQYSEIPRRNHVTEVSIEQDAKKTTLVQEAINIGAKLKSVEVIENNVPDWF